MTTPGFSNSAPDHESRTVTVDVAADVAAPAVDAETKTVDAPAPKKAARKTRAEGK